MYKLCQIDIRNREKIYKQIDLLVKKIRQTFSVKRVYLFGSFAKGEIHEGSDIDLLIIGDFKENFFERIGKILDLTDLPVEPLVYTEKEFKKLLEEENPFILEVLKTGKLLYKS